MGMHGPTRTVDLTGTIRDGMWSYAEPYPIPRISEIAAPSWIDYPVYSQELSMSVQTGTYLETAAHVDPGAMKIDELPIDRCFMLPTVRLLIPRDADGAIDTSDLVDALGRERVTINTGDGLIVGTGWDSHWDAPDFLEHPPYFTGSAIEWIMSQGVSLLGSDTPRYDSPANPANFLPALLSRDVLLLAPLVNLMAIGGPRGQLVALPLRIAAACASPVRALWVEGP